MNKGLISSMISSWQEMKIKHLIQLREIGLLHKGDDEKNMMVGALLAGIDYEKLLNMRLDATKEIMDNTSFLLEKPKPSKARNKYIINGKDYHLLKNVDDLTVAQYIDFQQLYNDGFEAHPREMLSIFLVPKGHKYNDGYDKQEVIEDMGELGVEEALGIVDFFMKRCAKSTKRMMAYSLATIKVLKILHPKEKERLKATELELNLIQEYLCEYGFHL